MIECSLEKMHFVDDKTRLIVYHSVQGWIP
jgi:hypothetical protein